MLFNSLTFLVFFALTYSAYLLLGKSRTAQNVLLLVASYVFYGAWNYWFLGLIIASTVVDYLIGQQLFQITDASKRKRLLTISVVFNLGVLGFFKYFDFFISSFADLMASVGLTPNLPTLNILLPVGISFYTFQTMSYTIDIYRNQLKPTKSIVEFGAFVAFFPQLVAGPIERAQNFLPQLAKARKITSTHLYSGSFLVLWGLFKKTVIADNMSMIVNPVFDHPENFGGMDLGLAVLAFCFQIYGDFSGYTDIARGLARLMGFELMINFKLPYFATNPSDFWRRWHVSLSSWLRDYLYIPLGGNRGSNFATYRNLTLTMLLGGLWHGAAWNYVLWGAFHGLILAGHRLIPDTWKQGIPTLPSIFLMFPLTLFGWLLFRAESLDQILYFITHFSTSSSAHTSSFAYDITFFCGPLVLVQIWQQRSGNLLVMLSGKPIRSIAFTAITLLMLLIFGVREQVEFIYFQF